MLVSNVDYKDQTYINSLVDKEFLSDFYDTVIALLRLRRNVARKGCRIGNESITNDLYERPIDLSIDSRTEFQVDRGASLQLYSPYRYSYVCVSTNQGEKRNGRISVGRLVVVRVIIDSLLLAVRVQSR